MNRRMWISSPVLCATLAALLLAVNGPATAQDDTQRGRKPSVQRQRIDRFIESTGAMTYEELAAALNKYSEGYELVQLAGMSGGGSPTPSVSMLKVLGDRRVAKMYEILSKEEPKVVAERASALFAEKLARQVEETRLTREKDPKADPSFGTAVHAHALNAAFFLCAITCDKATVLKHLEEWHAAFPDDHQLYPDPFSSGLPNSLFELNVYLLLLHRDGASQAELKLRVDELKREFGWEDDDSFKFEMLRLYRWNAHTTDRDFTHITRGAPTDDKDILLEVAGFRDWPIRLGLVSPKPDEVERVLSRGRAWVE